MSGLSLDYTGLVEALHFVEAAAGRSCAESLNRAGKHTIIGSGTGKGAMQLTPKATAAAINAVPEARIRAFVVQRLKRTGNWPKTRAEIDALTKKERARRQRAKGYAAYAGWSKAAKAMGGRGVKGVTSAFSRSLARHGRGRKATPKNLVAEIVNTAPAAPRIGFNALQQGINNAAADLIVYGTKKLQRDFKKVNT